MLILEVLFYIFIVVVIIQIVYYGFIFGNFSFSKEHSQSHKNISVSVIICAKNEAKNLKHPISFQVKNSIYKNELDDQLKAYELSFFDMLNLSPSIGRVYNLLRVNQDNLRKWVRAIKTRMYREGLLGRKMY